ncbi:hypothetical protein QQF64_015869 [Cirrhinus molitorella]|uniref:Uncharacterized protein n=1 Tax=Cirrhinus molitorella TaxID=172907 RepID=A0ABR3LL46_9TELE
MCVFVCSPWDFCLHDVLCESLAAYARDVFTHVTENNPRMCLREQKVGDDCEVVCWFILLSLLLLTECHSVHWPAYQGQEEQTCIDHFRLPNAHKDRDCKLVCQRM